ncbi:hypothetical protein QQY66_18710 [Streptomyces sp. DG2A-72]|uniref:hypothetical protein n=1 Tax=Streptomyces sp. DG2A-72 TaxID=3051386 RepID=UPI00265C31D1|nr:hypothetical protein [Streptomyces sp. DG2A-72]MDO0933615.1 hypothetical protein [Streptomyces sp. DG2A-72]
MTVFSTMSPSLVSMATVDLPATSKKMPQLDVPSLSRLPTAWATYPVPFEASASRSGLITAVTVKDPVSSTALSDAAESLMPSSAIASPSVAAPPEMVSVRPWPEASVDAVDPVAAVAASQRSVSSAS